MDDIHPYDSPYKVYIHKEVYVNAVIGKSIERSRSSSKIKLRKISYNKRIITIHLLY